MDKEDIKRILDKEPCLTTVGFETLSTPDFELHRQQLLDSAEACTRVVEWLEKHVRKISSINVRRSSYGLKHQAKKEIGYVSNGMFIAAAIHAGFRFKIDGYDARLNLEVRKVRQKRARSKFAGRYRR